ncbi:MAG: hypothetical protein SV062_13645, partial [Thermodesulfobacteriota bacterium]|nr:hypothetical protein [Thermodesulfobacteriota bacterium]
PFYYYLIQFWPRFFPWSLFLPSAVLFFYKGNPAFRNQRLFLLMWVLIIFVIIFSIDNKSYRYLLPLFPAYSLILGGAWQEAYLLKSLKKEGLIKWWEVSYKISLLIFIISIVAYPAFIWWVSHSIFLTLIFEFICIFGCILLGYAYFKGNPLIKVLAISLFALIIYGTYFFYISKEDKKHSPCMKMVSIIKPLVKVDSLKTFDFDKSLHLDFYLDTVVPKLETPSETVKFLTDKNSNSCLTSEKGYNLITSLLLKREFKIYSIQCRKKTYFLVMRKEKYDSSIQILFLN